MKRILEIIGALLAIIFVLAIGTYALGIIIQPIFVVLKQNHC